MFPFLIRITRKYLNPFKNKNMKTYPIQELLLFIIFSLSLACEKEPEKIKSNDIRVKFTTEKTRIYQLQNHK